MKIYKSDLDLLDEAYSELILPLVMVESGASIYGQDVSVEAMWNLISKSKKIDNKKKDYIVELFNKYYDRDDITYKTIIPCDSPEPDSNFIILNIQDITAVAMNAKRIQDMCNYISLIINIHSYMQGDFIYTSKNELLGIVKEYYPYWDGFNYNDSMTWFRNWPTDVLLEFSRFFVAYPAYEQIGTYRYSDDPNPLHEPFMCARNFDNKIKKLEEMGIICKVHTKYGQYSNKAVYCRVEHKEIAEALYNQIWENKQLAKKKAKEPKDEEDGG